MLNKVEADALINTRCNINWVFRVFVIGALWFQLAIVGVLSFSLL